jgi:hypothetical protein
VAAVDLYMPSVVSGSRRPTNNVFNGSVSVTLGGLSVGTIRDLD